MSFDGLSNGCFDNHRLISVVRPQIVHHSVDLEVELLQDLDVLSLGAVSDEMRLWTLPNQALSDGYLMSTPVNHHLLLHL